jgi:hypothetical protein
MDPENIWLAYCQTSPFGLSLVKSLCDAELGQVYVYRFQNG